MTTPTAQEEKLLPKELLDLPKEPKELPDPQNYESSNTKHQNDVKTLLSWTAPGRPFRKRRKQYYLAAVLITLFIEIILFLFAQYILMLLVMSLLYLSIALSSVAPNNFHYRISTEGITIEDHSFLWQELYDFYFSKQYGADVLNIRTRSFLPGEITVMLGDHVQKPHVKSILLPYLPYREVVRKTFMEKSGDWLARNFPLEKT
jgi:hypothetical protein